MAIHFDDTIGLWADNAETVRQQVADVFVNAFAKEGELNTDPETPAGQLIDSLSALVVAKDSEILYLANQFNPQTATGVWQDALAKIYFLDRKVATPTVVVCTCRGLYGTVIPSEAIVQDNYGYQYKSLETTTIDTEDYIVATLVSGENPKQSGLYELVGGVYVQTTDTTVQAGKTYYRKTYVAYVQFACTENGAIACQANSVNKIITVINGWDTVTNATDGALGNLIETQGSFEHRRYATVASNAHGSAYALEGALKRLSDVIDAKVLDNRKDEAQTIWGISVPRHSVAICVRGGSEEDIARTIYERLDAGVGTSGTSDVTFVGEDNQEHTYSINVPTVKTVYIKATINYTESTSANVEQEIRDAVYNDFIGNGLNPVAGLAQTIYASRFSVPIIQQAGVTDLVSVQIKKDNGSYGDSITLNANEYPNLPNDSTHIVVVQSN